MDGCAVDAPAVADKVSRQYWSQRTNADAGTHATKAEADVLVYDILAQSRKCSGPDYAGRSSEYDETYWKSDSRRGKDGCSTRSKRSPLWRVNADR